MKARNGAVAPLAGARIETAKEYPMRCMAESLPSRERELKRPKFDV